MASREHIYQGEPHAGQALLEVFDETDLASLEAKAELLEDFPVLEKVVFYGSSASGKSTLEQTLRSAATTDRELREKVSIPNRVVTRAPRSDDVNIDHYTPEEFQQMVANGRLGMHGVKVMEGGREEPYGISSPEEGQLPVYMANNTIVLYPNRIQPANFLEGALLVNVYAPDAVRRERLLARSPHMAEERPEEFAYRMSPKESSERMRAPAHIVVHNHGSHIKRTGSDIVKFIKALV